MKKMKKLFGLALLFSIALIPMVSAKADASCEDVKNEQGLKDALNESCTTITLGDNVELSAPIEITGKTVTIDGQGSYTISAAEGFVDSGNNGTLITAKDAGAKVTLKGLTLSGAHKYGSQAYNGGELTLDGVRIEKCNYGGVLANGGKVTIKKLDLGHNGESANNGIEISKGSTLTGSENNPEVIMDGILSSDEQDGVINVATNDTNLKEYTVTNTDNTENKLYVESNGVVVTDKNDAVVYVGNGKVAEGITGNQVTSSGETVVTHKVVIGYEGNSITIIIEDGQTLEEIANKLEVVKNGVEGKVFFKFILSSDGTDFDENKKITSDIELVALFENAPTSNSTTTTPTTNPNTGDNIVIYGILGLVSLLSLVVVSYVYKKKAYNN